MPPSSKRAIAVKGGAQGVDFGGGYLSEIHNEVISLGKESFKLFQHNDGRGSTMMRRTGEDITVTIYRQDSGRLFGRNHPNVTMIKFTKEGEFIDGWKL